MNDTITARKYDISLVKIASYTMKARLYPNIHQEKYMQAILDGIRKASNGTKYCLKNHLYPELEKPGKDGVTMFPDWKYIGSSAWLEKLRDLYPGIRGIVPGASLSSSVGGAIACDLKKGWEKLGKLPTDKWMNLKDKKGRPRVKNYCKRFPRTSFWIQIPTDRIEYVDEKHVWINLFPTKKFEDDTPFGRIRIRGWNSKITFDENGSPVPVQKNVGVRISINACGEWYIAFSFQNAYRPVKVRTDIERTPIGIDPGIKYSLTDSDGEHYENRRYKERLQDQINFYKDQMSRRQGSCNAEFRKNRKEAWKWNDEHKEEIEAGKAERKSVAESKRYLKAKYRAARLEKKAVDRRNNDQGVMTSEIIAKASHLYLESPDIKAIMQDQEMGILAADAAMGENLLKLKYKAEWSGIGYHAIDREALSTQKCSACGYVLKDDEKLKLGDREFVCPVCGHKEDRDENAAKVILATGKQEEADGIPSYVPPKEKPVREYKDTPVSKKHPDVFVHFSNEMKEAYKNPFVLVDKDGNVIDDAQGYGFTKAADARKYWNDHIRKKKKAAEAV